MNDTVKFSETENYMIDTNNMELYSDIDIMELDEITLKRIEKLVMNRAAAHNDDGVLVVKQEKKGFKGWFALQSGIRKAAAILVCCTALCGIALGCIMLIRQYVPGFGIVSDSSKLQVLLSPYTVWKDNYYLSITSLSYNTDTKVLSFTVESNGADGQGYDSGKGIVSGGIYFKEKWSRATPFEESLGKGHYQYGNPAAEYHDEFKLKKGLGDYYFELDIVEVSYDESGREVYTEKPEYIVFSLSELKLVSAKEANGLEDFGQIVESNGIRAASSSRWEAGKLYVDILFESNNSDEKIVSFNAEGENEIELVTSENQRFYNINKQSLSTGWNYLLFETDKPLNGIVSLNSLFIEKSVGMSVKLKIPKVGETIAVNREVDVDGIKVIIESIRAYNKVIEANGGEVVSYSLPDNELGIEAKCRIVGGVSKGRTADDKSYIKGKIKADNIESTSKGFSWGSGGLFISSHFKSEALKDISEITLDIDGIMLTAEGNWEIPIIVE